MYLKLKMHCTSLSVFPGLLTNNREKVLDCLWGALQAEALVTTGCDFCKSWAVESPAWWSSLAIPSNNLQWLVLAPTSQCLFACYRSWKLKTKTWLSHQCVLHSLLPFTVSSTYLHVRFHVSLLLTALFFALFDNSHRRRCLLYFPLFLSSHMCFPHTFYLSRNFRALYSFPPSALSLVLRQMRLHCLASLP